MPNLVFFLVANILGFTYEYSFVSAIWTFLASSSANSIQTSRILMLPPNPIDILTSIPIQQLLKQYVYVGPRLIECIKQLQHALHQYTCEDEHTGGIGVGVVSATDEHNGQQVQRVEFGVAVFCIVQLPVYDGV